MLTGPAGFRKGRAGNHGPATGCARQPRRVHSMIDPKLLRTAPDLVRRSQEARGDSVELVDELVSADEARRSGIATHDLPSCSPSNKNSQS